MGIRSRLVVLAAAGIAGVAVAALAPAASAAAQSWHPSPSHPSPSHPSPSHPSPSHPSPSHPSPSHPSWSHPSWSDRSIGADVRLRGLAPVSSRVAWVSGMNGTVRRTTDGGRHWVDVSPGGDTSTLDFRDIEASDPWRAVVLSIGEGGDSRIYRTVDGGRHWTEAFRNADPNAFYDCLAFFDGGRDGLALSDPVDGRFRLLRTSDGGAHWAVQDPSGMPAAQPGEFAFAASGTCLITSGRREAYIASGGGATTRVYRSHDGGRHFTAAATPIASGEAAGIFSVAARGPLLAAVGGDYTAPATRDRIAATSWDFARRWRSARVMPGGYRSGAAWLGRWGYSVIAVGPTGTDLSRDAGRTWRAVDTGSLDSVQTTRDGTTWASGEHGRVAVLTGC